MKRKCAQRGNFQRGFDYCGTDELKERLQANDIATFVDLAYCEEANEECLVNKCNTCGKDEDSKYRFLRSRLGDLSDETLDCAIGWQSWEKDNDGIWIVVDNIEPLSVALRIIVRWIVKEQMGLHERQVCLQSQFQRDIKSWDYERNEPHSSMSRDALCLRWDHAMRPLISNNQELQANHWLTHGIPLFGLIATYRENNNESELDGKLMKRHLFFTAPLGTKDHWHFTVLAVKEALKYLLPLIGARKQLICISDGSTKQVNSQKFIDFLITIKKELESFGLGGIK